ncbi:MAG: hypothetical protein A2700_01390 [Candidatus Blackburnbacteria bacterium RIFCSPHIGHO2_01_FULL_44_64]|uniref:Uncharacterized protein n=1 Tax=Candidatus Blackburnbacteria bacterium RIFCSPHIGHO2_02_FULL_44_20 TaxID=1797516 RepID=A0A1G1V4K8_9BACT|nr:MAG: hypothetical protein A2700_01390 [Candidatus Blackburnbacteria bacterium RIFCSPHIGHO2_01_FULL_44_64]OGY10330.1 MAG: hypothetical protein A3D26_03455 [Candidatus Blackburnbacteria bacterium RIFCSPHIGHO2_02_FULL_44_20]OGY11972.1 MAG: hypothetical protein A3E16_02085 [Candidatus Blackburnbacteria bacterium RIFCSPHIGHO2_12_FULL_44_25]OGY14822.1 MAG: hypothetical protein A3A62_03475 [Candidatus Blackburnbacteria bacterium RIFCSPLOWO2_01_FULL_44_43]
MYQRGIVHLLPLLLVAALVAAGLYFVLSGKVKLPSNLFSKKPKVQLETEYTNPFNKEAQYVNPFDTYKNPFTVSR